MHKKTLTLATLFALFASFTTFAISPPKIIKTTKNALIHVSSEAEFKEILKSEKPSLIDFYADWCGPCRILAPIIDELAEKYSGKAVVAKVNVDKFKELSSKYNVSGIPCIIFFKNEKEVTRFVGVRPIKDYVDAMDKIK